MDYITIEAPRIMPFERNPRFTGREYELSILKELLLLKEYTSQVAIFGLGFVGKTQLSIEMVYRTIKKHKDCMVFWTRSWVMPTLGNCSPSFGHVEAGHNP
jgi:hypothetical protein